MTWSLANGYFPGANPRLSLANHWTLAGITSLLFFASVLAHELGHSFLALRNNIPVWGITLFIFGGVARIGQEPGSPGVEFRIAIAGPMTSLAIAGLFGGLWLLSQAVPVLATPSACLAHQPDPGAVQHRSGFPLDGVRCCVRWFGRSPAATKSTRFAIRVGQIVAFGFIGFGLLQVLPGDDEWYLAGFIGWFLQNAANSAAHPDNHSAVIDRRQWTR
jgi:Zn-dependent protease